MTNDTDEGAAHPAGPEAAGPASSDAGDDSTRGAVFDPLGGAARAAHPIRRARRWRSLDIVVAAVLGVASGVIFWIWGLAWAPVSAIFALTPGLDGLTAGGWLFAGVLGMLVIRKPGAAVFTELVAGFVEMAIGNSWGASSIVWALVEGGAAEIVFLIVGYRHWRVWVASLAGAAAGVGTAFLDTTFSSLAGLSAPAKLLYGGCAVLSGLVVAGILTWLLVRALARTGVLRRFPSGRGARIVDAAGPAAG
ncbi:MAG TPA: ECF transporter S component [Microbacteriaceae bacterium]|nr:ECF transporter S component [Microbacteriaceae bacterium]